MFGKTEERPCYITEELSIPAGLIIVQEAAKEQQPIFRKFMKLQGSRIHYHFPLRR